ncbi:MAG: sulfite exporter TauE/SafE family protein [Firmicutes bacterium]|nr:sulfite exporter TauE/SafE family protein [Bacillota bacterium]
MKIFLLIICGIAGGVLGGMGMGGGTLLIPLLTIFMHVPQHAAQGANLTAFLPMASAALFVHIKNKLVVFKNCLYIILPALTLGAGGAFLARMTDKALLGKLFGGFLAALGFWMATADVIKIAKEKKERKKAKER